MQSVISGWVECAKRTWRFIIGAVAHSAVLSVGGPQNKLNIEVQTVLDPFILFYKYKKTIKRIITLKHLSDFLVSDKTYYNSTVHLDCQSWPVFRNHGVLSLGYAAC